VVASALHSLLRRRRADNVVRRVAVLRLQAAVLVAVAGGRL